MRAIIKNKLTGESICVTATTMHPDSSYGQPVWVDENGQSISIVEMPSPIVELEEVEMDEDRMNLGRIIKHLRMQRGESVRSTAEQCGFSPSTIQNIEYGRFSPRLDVLQRILEHFGATTIIKF